MSTNKIRILVSLPYIRQTEAAADILKYDKSDSQVRTVGIIAVNIRKRRPKNRNPALLYAFVDSLPMLRYRSPIRIPQTT